MTRIPIETPLRVTIVQAFGVLGGAERWLLRLLDATDRLDPEVILLRDGPLTSELERRGIRVHLIPTGSRIRDVLASSVRVASRLRRRRPEVVLANGVKSAAVAVAACRLTGVPVVWAKHDHSYDRWLARPLARLSDRVVAAVDELAEATGRADTVITPPPRPDPAPADREEARGYWTRRGVRLDGHPTLAMAGRLAHGKGIDDAIRALADPRARDWRLVVVGPDDPTAPGERDRLRRLVEDLGITGRVELADPVEDAARWLAGFDAVAVLTKSTDPRFGHEGFGTAAFEAMCAGVPVVASAGGAVSRRLAGRAGEVVPPGDPGAIAAALERLGDPAVRAAQGRAGMDLVEDHPDAAQVADLLASVLAESANRPGAGRTGDTPVSVVVTVLNEGAALDPLVDMLLPQLRDDDELLLVDGGSSDDTTARAARWSERDPRVRLLEAPGTNISEGRNAGIAAAGHDVVACTDAGCTPDAGWLDALRAPFTDATHPDLVAGVVRVGEGGVFQTAMTVAGYPDPREARRPELLTRVYGRLLGRTFDPSMPYGRSMAVTRRAWDRAGGFPQHLETAEDPTFGRAVVAGGGHAVLQAHGEVEWAPRPTPSSTARMYVRYGIGDGRSGDRTLIGRNLVRLAAYVGGPVLWTVGGPRTRALVAAGAALYLSLPVRRALRRARPLAVAAAVPAALALKDLAKVAGCLVGLARRR